MVVKAPVFWERLCCIGFNAGCVVFGSVVGFPAWIVAGNAFVAGMLLMTFVVDRSDRRHS